MLRAERARVEAQLASSREELRVLHEQLDRLQWGAVALAAGLR